MSYIFKGAIFDLDGVITGNANHFVGNGFVEGSGDVEWRIQLGRRYALDYGRILTTMGDLAQSSAFAGGGIRIYSNQRIQYLARITNFAALDPNGRVLGAIGSENITQIGEVGGTSLPAITLITSGPTNWFVVWKTAL